MGRNSSKKSLVTILNFIVDKNLSFFNPEAAANNKEEFFKISQELEDSPSKEYLNLFANDTISNDKLIRLKSMVEFFKKNLKKNNSSKTTSENLDFTLSNLLRSENSNNQAITENNKIYLEKIYNTHPKEFQTNSIQPINPTSFFSYSNPSEITTAKPDLFLSAINNFSNKNISLKTTDIEKETSITTYKEIDILQIQTKLTYQESIKLSKNLGENFKICIKEATDTQSNILNSIKNLPSIELNNLIDSSEIIKSIKDILENTDYTSDLNTHEIIKTFIQEYQSGNFKNYTNQPEELFKAFTYFILNVTNKDAKNISQLLETFDHQNPKICSQEFSDAIASLIEFLKEDKKLYSPNLNREEIVAELLSMLLFPLLMNQHDKPLCGVDVFLRELAAKSPLRFVQLGLNLAKEGFSTIPFDSKLPFDLDDSSIVLTMMCAIRHSYNLTGYHPKGFFQPERGDTSFIDLYTWFRASGFEIIEDSEISARLEKPINPNEQQISLLRKTLIGGEAYRDKHINIEGEQQIEHLKKHIIKTNVGISAVISPAFANLLKTISETYNEKDIPEPEGLNEAHWVKILDFNENTDKSINIQINTWGRIFNLTNLSRDTFKRHFHGALVTEFKNPLVLSDLPQQAKAPGCTLL
jgi:hypothetical protein